MRIETKDKGFRLHRPLAIALLLAWWVACWFATGAWFAGEASESYRSASANAERFVADAVPGFKRMLRTHGGVPRVLARDPDIRRALARVGAAPQPPSADEEERRRRWSADPDLAQTSKFLEISARELGFDAMVLLNADGDCVAASNAGSARSIVGAAYGARDGFLSARAGRSGYLASMGKRMGSAGISFYAPVFDQGRFIGVVTGGNALAPFANLIDQADAFLSDRNGVVLLARDASLMLHALPDAPVTRLDSAARQALYLRTELAPLDLSPWGDRRFPDLLRVPDRVAPVLLRSGAVEDGGLSVSVLWPLPQLLVLTQQRLLYAGMLGVVGTLLLLLVTGQASRRRDQRAMALALAEREQRVTDSRNFLDQIVNAVADPIFVKDREHRWVLVNQAFCKIHGQPCENFIGKLAHEVFPEPMAQRFLETDERVLSSGIESVTEEKLTDSEGVTHIVVIKKSPCTDAEGRQFVVGIISDITERKQVERLMRARERDFRTLAENAPDNIVRYDREGRIVYCNRRLEATLGASAADLIGNRTSKNFLGVHFEAYVQKLERVLSSGEEDEIEVVLSGGADGVPLIHQVRLVAERGENGEVCGALAIGRDITEHRRVEEALALREQEFRGLAENLPVAVIRYDAGCRRRYLNRSARRMLQGSTTELLGLVPGGGGIPASPAMIAHYRGQMDEVLATDTARELDFALDALPPNQQKHYEVRFEPEHGADGRAIGVLAIWYDVTERKRMEDQLAQREQEFRSLAESSPDFIVRLDLGGRYRYLNARVLSFLGLASAQEVIGKRPGDVYPDGRLKELEQAALRVAKSGNQESIELFVPGESGAAICHQIVIAPERDASGQIVGVIAFGRDITAIREAERRLQHFVDSLPGLVFTFHVASDGRASFPYVSPAIGEIYGLKPEDVKDDMAALHALSHPDDRPRIEAAIAESARTMTAFRIESPVCRPGHPERWLDVRSMPEHQPDGSILWYGLMLDITERKRMESALLASEVQSSTYASLLQTVVESSPEIIIFALDHDYCYLAFNELHRNTMRTIWGQEIAVGMCMLDVIGQYSDREKARQGFDRALAGESFVTEDAYGDEALSRQYWQTYWSPIRGEDGAANGLTCFVLNITERKRMEADVNASAQELMTSQEQLTLTEAWYRSILRCAPDGMLVMDESGFIVQANAQIEALFGYEEKELLGSSVERLLPVAIRDMHVNKRSEFVASGRVDRPMAPALRLLALRKDGSEFPVDISLSRLPDSTGRAGAVCAAIRDITERRRMEVELARREDKFRTLAENSPDAICRYDRDCRRLYMNRVVGKMIGKPVEELIGSTPADGAILVSEQSRKLMEAVRQVFDRGEPGHIDVDFLAPNGQHHDYDMLLVPERDARGQVLTVMTISRDISAIRDAERHMTRFLGNVPAFAFTFCMSPDGHFSFLFVSAGIKKLYGLHPDEVKDDMAPLHALAHPEDVPRIENIIAESARSMSELQVEFRVQRPGCPECWVECRSTPEREADGRILWHGIMLDITARKRLENALHAREQEFRALVENSPDAVFRYDLDCRRVYLNPAVERIMGVQAATLLGKTPVEGVIENVGLGEKQLTCVQWVLASGTPTETELTWVQADGTPRHFHMHYVPEFGLDGRVSSALAVGRDISALKQVEERLRKSRDVVRALAVHQETEHEKERRRLAYEIHEDLAQNFAALRMNISLIEMGGGFAPGTRLPQTMHAIVDRSIARIRQIVLMLRPTVLDSGLVPALQWITDDFKGVGFQFDVALQEDILLSDEVSTFLFRVAQEALLNIALHAGATHVQVSLDGVAGGCRLLVRDNGCGFDPGAPRSEDSFGLIRLAEQARHLGGDLFIDSAPGQGATLVIQLPG